MSSSKNNLKYGEHSAHFTYYTHLNNKKIRRSELTLSCVFIEEEWFSSCSTPQICLHILQKKIKIVEHLNTSIQEHNMILCVQRHFAVSYSNKTKPICRHWNIFMFWVSTFNRAYNHKSKFKCSESLTAWKIARNIRASICIHSWFPKSIYASCG